MCSLQEIVTKVNLTAGPYALPVLAVVGSLSLLCVGFKFINAFSSLFLLSGTNVSSRQPPLLRPIPTDNPFLLGPQVRS